MKPPSVPENTFISSDVYGKTSDREILMAETCSVKENIP
jgi:hypothetical protein